MSELSEALKAAQKKRSGWSLRRIEEEMEHAGHKVSFATIGAYLRGTHGTPDESTLQAFAAVFPELDIIKLRRLAGVPAGEGEPYVPPASASRLTKSQRDALNAVIAAMLEPAQPESADDSNVHPLDPSTEFFERMLEEGKMAAHRTKGKQRRT